MTTTPPVHHAPARSSVRSIGHESLRHYRLNPITFQSDDSTLDAAAVDAAIAADEESHGHGPLVGARNGLVITAEIVSVATLGGCLAGAGNDLQLFGALAMAVVCSLYLYRTGRAERRF